MSLAAPEHATPALEGPGGVSLLPFRLADVSERYVAWLNDREVTRYTEVRGRQSIESVRAYVETQLASRDVYFWRIVAEGRHIGNLRVSGLTSIHRRPVIALIVGERQGRGRGIGTAAIRLAADHLLDAQLAHKVVAGIYAENLASIRAFEKAGFHTEATLREHYWFENRFVDALQMAKFGHAAPIAPPRAGEDSRSGV